MTAIRFTDDEVELMLLAIEDFRKTTLLDYDDESRPGIAKEINVLARKLRTA